MKKFKLLFKKFFAFFNTKNLCVCIILLLILNLYFMAQALNCNMSIEDLNSIDNL